MKIDTADREVGELLTSGFFRIPRFQRPYCWEIAEVEDFWNDTIVETDSDYFIGAIVLYTLGSGAFGVVDGQQRLTTIAMTLCALRNVLSEENYVDLAEGIQGLIERKDINNQLQFVLQTETSYPFLQEQILKSELSDENLAQALPEEERLQKAFTFLYQKIREAADSVINDTALSNEKKLNSLKKRLLEIRDRLLSLKIIVTTLQDEVDAYTIFETLNTRGMDLTITDLVRTFLTRLLPATNAGVDRAKDRFNAMLSLFQASVADISMSSFLHHYWLSRHDYITEKKLYKVMRKKVRNKAEARDLLASLESDAKCYRILNEPSYRTRWRIEEADIRASLEALNLFRVKQQVPFVLSVMRNYERGSLGVKLTKKALRAVEDFHFMFTAVTSQRSSGGISFMYALHARQLESARNNAERRAAIQQLTIKLRQKLPPLEEFKAYFVMLLCSEKFTKRKALVRYILRRFAEQNLSGITPNWHLMTIEHLANQSSGEAEFSTEEVAEIGNLLFVSEGMNEKLESKPFAQKIKLLKRHNLVDDFLLKSKSWDAKSIRERSLWMAEQAYRTIWKI